MSAILIGVSETPSLVYYEQCPSNEAFTRMGLHDMGFGNWTGFYDWLRTDRGRILGVRYWPFENTEFLLNIESSGALKHDAAGALLIFLSSEGRFDEALSDDQSFEEARIFSGSTGKYALLLGCSTLPAEERVMLQAFAQRSISGMEAKGPAIS